MQPKWLNKEYKPVFKGPSSNDGQSRTIEHRTSGEFAAEVAEAHATLPVNRPDIVTLNHASPQVQAFDPGQSPRTE